MTTKQTASKTKSDKPKTPTKAQMAKANKLFGKEAEQATETEIKPQVQVGRRKTDAMAFSLQQLSTPISAPVTPQEPPKMATPPAQLEQFQAELEALKAKFNITAPVEVPKAQKPARLQLNGVTRPAESTKCGLIWRVADELTASSGATATISALKQHKSLAGINDHTLKTQYARWRAYNGVHGRVGLPVLKTPEQATGEYAGLSPLSVVSKPTK